MYRRTVIAASTLELVNLEHQWETLLHIFGRDHRQYRCEHFRAFEAIAPYHLASAHKPWIVTLKGNNPNESYNSPVSPLSTGDRVRVVDYSRKNDPIFPEFPYAFGVLERLLWREPGYTIAKLLIILNSRSILPSRTGVDRERHNIAIPSELISETDKQSLEMKEGTIGQGLDPKTNEVTPPLRHFDPGAGGYKGEFAGAQMRFAS